ncbi:MAG: lipopolysaccharide transport periplasmic protein LptA [Geminicoccaceae bacterium]|nr:lipopolysaccharide transport periplasmic protein LptA [Geminicoccaceae bacterium]
MSAWLLWAAPGSAQETLGAHDTSLPIEIEADELNVVQDDERATFAGNVQVIQGDLSLRADRLAVLYALDGGTGAGGQAIRRIEAEGDVVLASPAESATGDRGSYDVAAGEIVLEGHVTLTRGENVIEGGRLTIDLARSRATMRADTKDGTGRVRALFVPPPKKAAP